MCKPPTPSQFLSAWVKLHGDPAAVLDHLGMKPENLHHILADPAIKQAMDAFESLLARHARIKALRHQITSGDSLSRSLAETADPVELRRGAAILARLSHQMHSATRALLAPRKPAPPVPDTAQSPEHPEPPPPSLSAAPYTPNPFTTQPPRKPSSQPLTTIPTTPAARLTALAGATPSSPNPPAPSSP